MSYNSTIKIPNPEIRIVNSTILIGPYSTSPTNGVTSARLGYQLGAETIAKMFSDLIMRGDNVGAYNLAKATQTKSFYEYRHNEK